MDYDGYEEAYLRGSSSNYMFTSRDGGQLVALEDKDNLFNFQNTLTRREEAYHQKKLFETADTAEQTGQEETEGVTNIHDAKAPVDEEYKKNIWSTTGITKKTAS